MAATNYAAEIAKELQRSAALIADAEAGTLADLLLQANRVFVVGAGRSGLMGRAFAMRLMHTGISAYVVGETITPGIDQGDVLIVGTGSGETRSLIPMAQQAKSLGASLVAVTIAPESTIGRLADTVVKLPGSPKAQASGSSTSIQPMASLFEQTLLIFYDAVILSLMDRQGQDADRMYGRHANLE